MDVLKPYSVICSDNIIELLEIYKSSIAVTMRRNGKIALFSAAGNGSLIQLLRNFSRPMGMAVFDNKLALAVNNEVLIYGNEPSLAPLYHKNPNTYDNIYLPRVTLHSGALDLPSMTWTSRGLIAANTTFSCVSLIKGNFSFTIEWKPEFISELLPEDRCHLNGLVCDEDGSLQYVTALAKSDSPLGWKEKMLTDGVLIDVADNRIILDNLPMPNSPRIYNGELYLLLSGIGQLVKVDQGAGKFEVVTELPGFARCMSRLGDYLFIGLSKVKRYCHPIIDLPMSDRDQICGVVVVDIKSGKMIGQIKYLNSAQEISDITVLPGKIRPNILNKENTLIHTAFVNPEKSLWVVPKQGDGSS